MVTFALASPVAQRPTSSFRLQELSFLMLLLEALVGLVCSRFLTLLEGSSEFPPRLQEPGFPQQSSSLMRKSSQQILPPSGKKDNRFAWQCLNVYQVF